MQYAQVFHHCSDLCVCVCTSQVCSVFIKAIYVTVQQHPLPESSFTPHMEEITNMQPPYTAFNQPIIALSPSVA